MPHESTTPRKPTKGERTRLRIMDVAEELFSRQGYEATTLRQIAAGARIREPGLYNHFSGKQALYEAMLLRALQPIADALTEALLAASDLRDYTDLPAVMTDLLLEHPQMATLFQQALQGDESSVATRLLMAWLEELFDKGLQGVKMLGGTDEQDRATLALNVIAMFNLTTGYFTAQRAFDSMAEGDLRDPDNIARQKSLLRKVVRAMLIN